MAEKEKPVSRMEPGPRPSTSASPVELVIEVTDHSWESVVERATKPVAVMFYSPSCGFCHQMEPYFQTYAREYHDTVIFVKTDVLKNPWSAERHGIRSTPTFAFFCNGKPIRQIVGAVYPALIKKTVDEVLAHGKECAENSTAIDYEITGYG